MKSYLLSKVILLAVCFWWAMPVVADTVSLGRPGYLIIESARDASGSFVWQAGSGDAEAELVWDGGRLWVADSSFVESFAQMDIGLPVSASLVGRGAGGIIHWQDGVFAVSENLVLEDGVLRLEISTGELEIRDTNIRYRRAATGDDGRGSSLTAGLAFLAGMALLILTLMRRARLQWKDKGSS